MKRKDSSERFWTVLTSVNVLVLIYPIASLLQADSDAGQFLSAVVVVSVVFMLGLIDTVAIFGSARESDEVRILGGFL